MGGASLEGEQRAKADALRVKKKLESDINELEIALDHANKANIEGQKAVKRYQGSLRDTIQSYEDETRSRQQITEAVGIAERKANALYGEVEESRALLDSADRAKRQIDADLADARGAINEMQVINSKALHEKRNVESTIHTLQAEIDDMLDRPRTLRRSPRGPWLTLLAWLMSSGLSRIMPLLRAVESVSLTPRSMSWRTGLLMPRLLP